MNGIDFALALFVAVAGRNAGKNVLVSPYSVRQAVGLAYIGANGKTRDQIALALPAPSVPDFEQAEKKNRLSLAAADPEVELDVASSLCLKEGVVFRASYVDAAKSAFDAAAFVRPFGPAALAEFNAWVSGRTKGRIPTILDDLSPNAIAVIVDAVYFKGGWKKAFDKSATKPDFFHPGGGASFPHPMMNRGADRFEYFETDKYQAVRLPYGSGRLGMIVVLPARDSNLGELVGALSPASWKKLRGGMLYRKGTVELPRFKSSFSAFLKAPLTKLGMVDAFDEKRADFGAMAELHGPVWIDDVVHKTFIAVDEEGTEAAAATAVLLKGHGDGPIEPRFRFDADRPFLYAIEDAQTGTILFLGALNDPR